jgi:hypothetical protein
MFSLFYEYHWYLRKTDDMYPPTLPYGLHKYIIISLVPGVLGTHIQQFTHILYITGNRLWYLGWTPQPTPVSLGVW